MIFTKLISFFDQISVDGYVSIIGSFITLIGTYITVKFAKSQVKEDKRIGIKPYLKIYLRDIANYMPIDKETAREYMNEDKYKDKLVFSPIEVLGDLSSINVALFSIDFSNVGLEKAIDFKVSNVYERIGTILKRSFRFNKKYVKYYSFDINKDSSEHLSIKFIYSIDRHKLKKIGKMSSEEFEKIKNVSLKTMYIDFTYKDLLNNKYRVRYGINFTLTPIYDDKKNEIVGYMPDIQELEENYKEKLLKDNIFTRIKEYFFS